MRFNTILHLAAYFRDWLSDPRRVASIVPSGPVLARMMTREVVPHEGPILELGPGTGAFTRALLNRGVGERDLTLVEFGERFAGMLERQFPQARVVRMDAAQLSRRNVLSESSFASVISGLPLLSMSARNVIRVLVGAFRYLRPGGAFLQFTYGPLCPVSRDILNRLGLRATLVGWTVRNLPPAAVYRIVRRQSMVTAGWQASVRRTRRVGGTEDLGGKSDVGAAPIVRQPALGR